MVFLYFFFREDLDEKAAFVTAIGALHDLHTFAKEEVLGRRSRIPVSCAGCLFIIRSLFARVDEVTSEKWRPRLDLTSSFRTEHQVWPSLAAWVYSHGPTSQVCSIARVGRGRATRVRVLDYVG